MYTVATLAENYTFFKNEDGVLYGVSPRVMATGYTPTSGHVLATEEEKDIFIDCAAKNLSYAPKIPDSNEVTEETVVEDLLGKTPQNLPVNSVVPTKTSQNLYVNFGAEEPKLNPIVLSPTEQKRRAFFETLTEEEVSYYEGLENQGLSTAQLYKIKVAKNSKTIRRKVN